MIAELDGNPIRGRFPVSEDTRFRRRVPLPVLRHQRLTDGPIPLGKPRQFSPPPWAVKPRYGLNHAGRMLYCTARKKTQLQVLHGA